MGKAAVCDQATSADKSADRLTWEGALGAVLGSKRSQALSDNLPDEELQSAATESLDSFLKSNVDASDHEAATWSGPTPAAAGWIMATGDAVLGAGA